MLSLLPIAEMALSKQSLVQDLAAVMLVAGLFAALFHYLGWPKVIGYIAAGTVMGLPNIKGFLIASENSVNVLANLGIIFLMFTMGLELNIRKLRKIGGMVFPTATYDLAAMLLIGYATGKYILGWGFLPSIFLGAVLCDSSTTLLAKSLEEMGCTKEYFASIIFGTTLSEDILTIGVMAILTGLAITGQFQAAELGKQLCLLVMFLTGVLVFGFLMLPRFLNRIRQMRDEETLLIIILGICFGIAFIAEKMQFSLALGAFLVGAVVAESSVSHRVHEHTAALKHTFSAVFFVTIGLMVDLHQMWDNLLVILLLSLIVVAGKTANCMIASYITGLSHKDAIKTGIGLAQIGDFAYLVALLGIELCNKADPYPKMYQLAVGVSVITTLVNPFLLKASQPFSEWLDRKMPARLRHALESYTLWMQRTGRQVKKSTISPYFKRNAILYVTNLLLLAVIFAVAHYLQGKEELWKAMPTFLSRHRSMLLWLLSCLFSFPIFAGVYINVRRLAEGLGKATHTIDIPSIAQPMEKITNIIVTIILMSLVTIEFTALSILLIPSIFEMVCILVCYVVIGVIWWKRIQPKVLETQENLQMVFDREDAPPPATETLSNIVQKLPIPDQSGAIGRTIAALRLRNRTGVTITKILRLDGEAILNPGPRTLIQKGDTLFLLASEEQLKSTEEFFSKKDFEESPMDTIAGMLSVQLFSIHIPANGFACGKSMKELRFRNATGANVVKIIPKDAPPTEFPDPDRCFQPDDKVTVFCTAQQLELARKLLIEGLPQ
ncbi:MAG: cation:proton antiporter [Victivallales bacterium]|nr:cation:proton antiporter [Victivallales bacterium]